MLINAHDESGLFAWALMHQKLNNLYWPVISKDIKDFILGRPIYARNETVVKSQNQEKVIVRSPMELLGIDMIGPFPGFENGYNWILICTDYFSRFTWAKVVEKNDSDSVIGFLKGIFEAFGVPVGIYSDRGPHFGSKSRKFAKGCGVIWRHAIGGAKRAVGSIEKTADILQCMLKESTPDPKLWPSYLPGVVYRINKRYIPYLTFSPLEIFFGFDCASTLDNKFQSHRRGELAHSLRMGLDRAIPDVDGHTHLVQEFVLERTRKKQKSLHSSEHVKDVVAQNHDLGINAVVNFNSGDLVMLYDQKQSRKKTRPSWRGPFVIAGYKGDMERSYTLKHIDGTPIPRHYNGDSLKIFRLREGYLVANHEEVFHTCQNMALGTAAIKLPKQVKMIKGSY